jgi:hypothetical protein
MGKETLMKTVVDCSTGVTTVEPLTAEEIAQYEIDVAEFAARDAAREAEILRITTLKESARAKLVAGQPLTEEEAATIVL